jgi:hypothetical protein
MKRYSILPACFIAITLMISECVSEQEQTKVIDGPLRVSKLNPGYFTDNSGDAIYLTGAHTWNNLVDMTSTASPEQFDYSKYIRRLKNYNHNFIRLWIWELLDWDTEGNRESNPQKHTVAPHPWMRSGPGRALDGNPEFDLTRFDPEYFDRLEKRVKMAYDSGIYVSIMLFEGWGLQFSPGAFENHPFNPANNINGINGDYDGDGSGTEIHSMGNNEILEIQEAYVKHLIDRINRYDNVLYEISNENHPASTEWQYHMINFIKDYEKNLPGQHPVGMTFQYRGGSNQVLFDSPADWISPNPEGGYRDDPPAADGSKVILTDTDHLWGIGGNTKWIWKSFFRGLNPLFMDPYDCRILKGKDCDTIWMDSMRKGMGLANMMAHHVDLITMTPDTILSSSHYCLTNRSTEFLVYFPDSTKVDINLAATDGSFDVEWFNTATGGFMKSDEIQGGRILSLTSPFDRGEAIVYLKKSQ